MSQIKKLTILSDSDIKKIDNNGGTIGALTVNGAISSNKGVKLGFSDVCEPGLIIFDGLNFIGFNKNGWTLLSNNTEPEVIEDKIIQNGISKINVNIDDDSSFIHKINTNINRLIINFTKIEFYKVHTFKLNLINNITNKIVLSFENNDIIFQDGIKLEEINRGEIIVMDVEILDNIYLISYKIYKNN